MSAITINSLAVTTEKYLWSFIPWCSITYHTIYHLYQMAISSLCKGLHLELTSFYKYFCQMCGPTHIKTRSALCKNSTGKMFAPNGKNPERIVIVCQHLCPIPSSSYSIKLPKPYIFLTPYDPCSQKRITGCYTHLYGIFFLNICENRVYEGTFKLQLYKISQ